MGLGTTESTLSLALAFMPPGNAVRDISRARRALWASGGDASAGAWFDFPVVAWLGEALGEAALSRLANSARFGFELGGPLEIGGSVFLPFGKGCAEAIAGILEEASSVTPIPTIGGPHKAALAEPPGSESRTRYAEGPFAGGIGCYCCLGGGPLPRIGPLKAKTFLVAQVELRWTGAPSYGSEWRTLSAARAAGPGGLRPERATTPRSPVP